MIKHRADSIQKLNDEQAAEAKKKAEAATERAELAEAKIKAAQAALEN